MPATYRITKVTTLPGSSGYGSVPDPTAIQLSLDMVDAATGEPANLTEEFNLSNDVCDTGGFFATCDTHGYPIDDSGCSP